jgi:phosphohistidine phosphatase
VKLLIVRHAPAEDRKAFAETGRDDALRPLTDEGREKMREVAAGLCCVVPTIDVLASSPLERAQQTAALIAAEYRGLATLTIDELAPDARGPDFLRWLRTQAGAGVIAVVGHEPHLGHLASWLLTGREEPFLSLKKGGALLLDFGDFVQAGLPRLVWAIPPRLLRALATSDR